MGPAAKATGIRAIARTARNETRSGLGHPRRRPVRVKILGTDVGGIRAVAEGEWAATFSYPTGASEAIEMAKSILLDCAEKVPTVVTAPTTAIAPDNAKQTMGNTANSSPDLQHGRRSLKLTVGLLAVGCSSQVRYTL